MSEYFLIAKIVSIIGKDGFVKILSFSDFPERFQDLKKVYFDFFGEKKEFVVEAVKQQKNSFALKFKNFDNDNDVKILLGKEIFVDEANIVKLPENYFFIHDLIGSTVFRNEKEIGKIKDVLSYPANDVYLIQDNNGSELLIPALSDLIESFDPKEKILILKSGGELYDDED